MAGKRGKGTCLKVFSGREASLNFLIFLILYPDGKLLASYDIFKEVRAIKGFRHKGKQNVDRRVKALYKQHWLETQGIRYSRPHFISPLYKLSVRGRAAIELRKKDLNVLLLTAPEDQLQALITALKMYP
ncbi:MAG: hypothetical protein NWF04_06640 [Candidatus Bathyarchaeota archaeon]|nr:hypothetical protein [Candidatus Bathyarchaeota archaeon]